MDDQHRIPEVGMISTELGHRWLVIDGVNHHVSNETFVLARWLAALIAKQLEVRLSQGHPNG